MTHQSDNKVFITYIYREMKRTFSTIVVGDRNIDQTFIIEKKICKGKLKNWYMCICFVCVYSSQGRSEDMNG